MTIQRSIEHSHYSVVISETMRLYFPAIGDIIYLSSPWTFHLPNDYRNRKFTPKLPSVYPTTTRSQSTWKRKLRYEFKNSMFNGGQWIEAGVMPWETPVGNINPNTQISERQCDATDPGAHECIRTWEEVEFPSEGLLTTIPKNAALRFEKIEIKRTSTYDLVSFTWTNIARDPLLPKTKRKIQVGKFLVHRLAVNDIQYEMSPILSLKEIAPENRFAKLEHDNV